MNRTVRGASVLLMLIATSASAQTVQIAPFAAYQFGGSFYSVPADRSVSLSSGFAWGGTLDVAIGKTWRLEGLFSKQSTEIQDDTLGIGFDLAVERYMIGIQEEKGADSGEKMRYFGSLLLGTTRFVPGVEGFDSVSKFSAALTLGVKTFPTKNLGLRFEARAFYTSVDSNSEAVCVNGQCLFLFSSSGFWQGDVNAAVILAF